MNINFLPWRMLRRQQQIHRLYLLAIFSIPLSIGLIILFWYYVSWQITEAHKKQALLLQQVSAFHLPKNYRFQIKQYDALAGKVNLINYLGQHQKTLLQNLKSITVTMPNSINLTDLNLNRQHWILMGNAASTIAIKNYIDALGHSTWLKSIQLAHISKFNNKLSSFVIHFYEKTNKNYTAISA